MLLVYCKVMCILFRVTMNLIVDRIARHLARALSRPTVTVSRLMMTVSVLLCLWNFVCVTTSVSVCDCVYETMSV